MKTNRNVTVIYEVSKYDKKPNRIEFEQNGYFTIFTDNLLNTLNK